MRRFLSGIVPPPSRGSADFPFLIRVEMRGAGRSLSRQRSRAATKTRTGLPCKTRQPLACRLAQSCAPFKSILQGKSCARWNPAFSPMRSPVPFGFIHFTSDVVSFRTASHGFYITLGSVPRVAKFENPLPFVFVVLLGFPRRGPGKPRSRNLLQGRVPIPCRKKSSNPLAKPADNRPSALCELSSAS